MQKTTTVELAIVTALPEECAAVYAALGLPVPHIEPGWTIVSPGTVALVCTGAGKVAAGTELTRFLERVTPGRIVCGGIAGGLNPMLAPGDSVIAGRCWFYDRDATAAKIPLGAVARNRPDRYDLVTAAAAAAATQFPVATVATGDSVVTERLWSALPPVWQERLENSDVVDMESTVWVEVASQYDLVPVVCRTVFDRVPRPSSATPGSAASSTLAASAPETGTPRTVSSAPASSSANRKIGFRVACRRAGEAITEIVRAGGHTS